MLNTAAILIEKGSKMGVIIISMRVLQGLHDFPKGIIDYVFFRKYYRVYDFQHLEILVGDKLVACIEVIRHLSTGEFISAYRAKRFMA